MCGQDAGEKQEGSDYSSGKKYVNEGQDSTLIPSLAVLLKSMNSECRSLVSSRSEMQPSKGVVYAPPVIKFRSGTPPAFIALVLLLKYFEIFAYHVFTELAHFLNLSTL